MRIAIAAALICAFGCCESCPTKSNPKNSSAALESREYWDVYLMQNKRIGYGRVTIRAGKSAQDPVATEAFNHLAVKRDGQIATQDIRTSSLETPQGVLNRYECEMRMGKDPASTVGEIKDGRLVFKVTAPGASDPKETSIPWSSDFRGPFAVEQSLLRRPMKPNERRGFKMLMMGFNQAADVEMIAQKIEPTALLDGNRELLRIETVTTLADKQKIDCTLWTDAAGEILKTHSQAMSVETYRTSKAEALKNADLVEMDLLASSIVKVEQPLPNAHLTKQVRYRVRLDGGDPAGVFSTGLSQAVKSIDPHTAEITVYAVRPEGDNVNRMNPEKPDDRPAADDLDPNSLIESDDPAIIADAKKAAGDETDPWRTVLALEKYVNREIKKKNFTQAFATASEVCRSREGDCTEHAVFLAALCRARKIPARVAVGLVYMQGQGAFGYHLWTEAYIGRHWIPIDGTLALGGIGAGHLKICNSNLKDAGFSAFLPVAQILGRLQIDVIDAK